MKLIEELAWDSAFFGLSVGRVRECVGSTDVELVVNEAEAREIRCAYLLTAADDYELLDSAYKWGFQLRDIRVKLERPVSGHPSCTTGLRRGRPDDMPRLSEIARTSFQGTRFFADERFPPDRSSALYVTWLRRGLAADPCWITLVTEDLSGFVLCRLDPPSGVGAISLIAVASDATGRGLGRRLVAGAGSVFADSGLTCATVITQGHNVAAQRLYQANGYRTAETMLWLHRWAS